MNIIDCTQVVDKRMNCCLNYFLQLLSKNSNRSPTTGTQSKLWPRRACTFRISSYKCTLDTGNAGCFWSHQETQGWQCTKLFFFSIHSQKFKNNSELAFWSFSLYKQIYYVCVDVEFERYLAVCLSVYFIRDSMVGWWMRAFMFLTLVTRLLFALLCYIHLKKIM